MNSSATAEEVRQQSTQEEYEIEDRPADLTEHLEELRTRIIRAFTGIFIGWVAGYILFPAVYHVISQPLREPLRAVHGQTVFLHFADPFFLRLKLSFVVGLIFAAPYVTYQIWAFVAPGLTRSERRVVKLFIPFSGLLFAMGVVLGYLLLPAAIRWFLSYLEDYGNATLLQNPLSYVLLAVKILLAFGISFQLPIVLIVLAKLGLVTSKRLMSYWRHAVVIISVVAAIITPTNDPLSMTVMALPMVFLYFLTIGVVRRMENSAARRNTANSKKQESYSAGGM
ncbi:MAG: twin-arginine translocase subunit TatC [Armatimonadota bacterium]|nr:twin-arginine translocase subunit TatC [bacterium]MDW8322335.1 twin-arginine translocase subunit TatC [Armatimonadota bacterium]